MSNTSILIKGANMAIERDHHLEVRVEWTSAPADLDVSCFMVDSTGKVPSDNYFIFYNQATDPNQHIVFKPVGANAVHFSVHLDGLVSSGIEKCVFAATLDGPGTFAGVRGGKVIARTSQQEVMYEINDMEEETSVVLVELYRHQSWFKLRAVGRGFNGGLKPLAEAHGVNIAEPEAAPSSEAAPVSEVAPILATVPAVEPIQPPAPEVILSKISLLKQKVTVSLQKRNLNAIKARVAVVIDASGSMSMLYSKGVVQRAFERVLAVAACMDDDGVLDVWFFGSKSMRAPSVTEQGYENYIKRTYPKPKIFGGVGSGNNEPVVMEDVIQKYTKEQPDKRIPTYVVFFSDGGIYETHKISKLLIESSKKNIFWQFVGIGQADYGILRKLDTLSGRYIDNASFFALDDLDQVSDEELYDRLFEEFPQWLHEAKQKRILLD